MIQLVNFFIVLSKLWYLVMYPSIWSVIYLYLPLYLSAKDLWFLILIQLWYFSIDSSIIFCDIYIYALIKILCLFFVSFIVILSFVNWCCQFYFYIRDCMVICGIIKTDFYQLHKRCIRIQMRDLLFRQLNCIIHQNISFYLKECYIAQ